MAVNVATLVARLEADIRDFDRDMKIANRRLDQLEGTTQKVGTGAGKMAKSFDGVGLALKAAMGAAATRQVMRFAQDTVRAASDLNESMNKVSVVFGRSSDEIIEWSETSAEAMGLSQSAALEAVGGFGAMFDAMGVNTTQAAEMSQQIVQLSADMGSFNNIDPTEMLVKLQSGLAGEVEPLRRFGVDLSATAVAAKAMELGLADSTDALDAQDKLMARYFLILEQTTKQQGDFARTSDDMANAARTAAGQIENLKAQIGEDLAPAAARGLTIVGKLAEAIGTLFTFDPTEPTQPRGLFELFSGAEERQRKAALAAQAHDTALEHLADQLEDTAAASQGFTDEMAAGLAEIGASAREAAEAYRLDLIDEMGRFLTLFDEVPDQIDLSLDQMQTNFEKRFALQDRFWRGLATLARAGFDDLVAELQKGGPEAAAQVEALAGDLARAAEFEGMIESAQASMSEVGATITDALGIEKAAWIAAFYEAGEAMAIALEAALTSGDRLASLQAAGLTMNQAIQYGLLNPLTYRSGGSYPRDVVPDMVRTGGAGGGAGGISEYQFGGVVPGPVGAPQLAVVHGGETITPPGEGTIINVNQYISEDYRDPAAARRIVRELARELKEYDRETRR